MPSYVKLCLCICIYLCIFHTAGSAFNGPFISGSPQLGNCIEDGPRVRYWHLVKNSDDHHDFHKDHSHKAIPEIFLTRLLSTKVRKYKIETNYDYLYIFYEVYMPFHIHEYTSFSIFSDICNVFCILII